MLTIHRSRGCTASALRWAWYDYVKNVIQYQQVSIVTIEGELLKQWQLKGSLVLQKQL